ncbi:hypothetical protein I3842_06G008600 [Carya illinoinensis]|uniref:Ion transport domain-containing protein n=1 Tax=Carya illinoinensis TaxID=32201 RepID=A0A922ESQ8_CARIL|nr:hypothetical protein I3842_06G008600 [Carya illinoinensis]
MNNVQVLMPIIFSEMRTSKIENKRKFLNAVVLLQYVPRIFRIYRLWKIVNETIILRKRSTKENVESYKNLIPPKGFVVIKAGFNLLLYLVASHALGACWYFFSIQRETTCWYKLACERDINECSKGISLDCGTSGFGNYTFLNDFCSIENPNTTLFDFGIFEDAHQSGILSSMDFPRKNMFCFWWGLRNLSSLGQNLQTSTYYWENCFTVLISIFGLLLFLYFIGNLQIYMQWDASNELDEIKSKWLKNKEEKLIKGIVCTCTSNHDDKTDQCPDKCEIIGENLVQWVLESPKQSNPPSSEKNFKCLTKVEAFRLTARDLNAIFKLHPSKECGPSFKKIPSLLCSHCRQQLPK